MISIEIDALVSIEGRGKVESSGLRRSVLARILIVLGRWSLIALAVFIAFGYVLTLFGIVSESPVVGAVLVLGAIAFYNRNNS